MRFVRTNDKGKPVTHHPVGCAHNCLSFSFLFGKLGSITKIGNFDFTVLAQKDVVTLNVSVYPVTAVYV